MQKKTHTTTEGLLLLPKIIQRRKIVVVVVFVHKNIFKSTEARQTFELEPANTIETRNPLCSK